MKHAAAKEKPSVKAAKAERVIPAKKVKETVKVETISPVKNTQTKAVKKSEPTAKKINLKEKPAKTAAVVSKSKLAASKSVPVSSVGKKEKKNEKTKITPAVLVKRTAVKTKKSVPVIAAAKLKVKKKKIELVTSLQKKTKNKLSKQPTIPAVSIQKIKPQTKKPEIIAPVKVASEFQKIKSAVNVGRINAALKAIEAAQILAAKTNKTEKKKSSAAARKSKVAEAKIETAALQTKIKPKNVKQIGAAVFRGRKNRYDFQVYPLDFAFENVSAIYVISRRKTDSKKRGHHALVCIGQTNSIVDELRKHTGGKCVKKHEANVISILPEPNEKKRLKIEEDLRAAHSTACNLALE